MQDIPARVNKGCCLYCSPHFRQHEDGFGSIVSTLTGKRLEKHNSEEISDFLGCFIEDCMGKKRSLERREIEAEASILCKLCTPP